MASQPDHRLASPVAAAPEPAPEELTIRVEWARMDARAAHLELCGIVACAGRATAVAPGTRVVATAPGEAAVHRVVPARATHPVPSSLDPALAVLAMPLAVVAHALDQVVQAPRRTLVLGHGTLGALAHAELARRCPDAAVVVVEPAPLRAALARAFGAEVLSRAAPESFDLVIVAGGSLSVGLTAAARGADVLMLSGAEATTLVPDDVADRGLRLIGGSAGVDGVPRALGLLASEGWRYVPVITDAVPLLADAPPDAVAVLIRP